MHAVKLKAALKERLSEKENHRDVNERHDGLTDGDRCTTWRLNSLASPPAAVDPGTRKEGLPGFTDVSVHRHFDDVNSLRSALGVITEAAPARSRTVRRV